MFSHSESFNARPVSFHISNYRIQLNRPDSALSLPSAVIVLPTWLHKHTTAFTFTSSTRVNTVLAAVFATHYTSQSHTHAQMH